MLSFLTYFVKLGITDLGALTVKLYQNIATLIEEFVIKTAKNISV